MPRHRSLTLRTFVDSISPDLMERYFTEKFPDNELLFHIIMDTEAVEEFMADPRNAQVKGLIREDFSRINDICDKGKNHVVKAYNFFEISMNGYLTPQGLAMKLLLDHREAFDYAYAWHCYYNTSSKMSHHHIPGNFELTKDKTEAFREEVKEWFESLAKGRECIVTPYNEDGITVMLVKHGSYVRTIAHWKDQDIETYSYRPANEDILLYDKDKGVLSIKASLEKDRQQYIRLFSKHIMDDESLADSENLNSIYSLKPLQDGSFNWDGNEVIRKIILTKIKLVFPDENDSVHEIASKNVRQTLRDSGLDLSAGKLTYARFRFVLDIDGKLQKVSFMIAPPDVTDLVQKKHCDIISEYLKEQGIRTI